MWTSEERNIITCTSGNIRTRKAVLQYLETVFTFESGGIMQHNSQGVEVIKQWCTSNARPHTDACNYYTKTLYFTRNRQLK